MAEFQVHHNNSASAESYPFLVDIQSDLLSGLDTRLVIPLSDAKAFERKGIKNLNPMIWIGSAEYIILTQQMAAVPKSVLGELVAQTEPNRTEILSAIDFLITGI